jgi:branched-chain amino acid transport system substrate-binding protein
MVQQINDKGGLLGRKLTVISKDDESTPAVGVSRANEMVAEKADIVIEGWNSPVTLAMQPILARGNILDFTAVSKSDLILSGETNPYAMRINSSNGFDAEVIAKYVAQTMKAKKIAFLTQNDVYGNGFQTAVEAEFKKMNFSGEVIMTEKFAFKDTDFRVQLTNIKGANPDAVIVTSSSNSSAGRSVSPGRHKIHLRRRRRHHAEHRVQGRRRRQQRRDIGRHLFPRSAAVHDAAGERSVRRRLQEGLRR